MEIQQRPPVSIQVKKHALESAISQLADKDPFYAGLLQEVNIRYTEHEVPTAAIYYDKKKDSFEMILNPHFFCKLNSKHRVAILSHEILHFTWQHLFRLFKENLPKEEHKLLNIAADMAINQYIENIPHGCPECPPVTLKQPCKNELCPGRCVDYKDFRMNDGSVFPARKTAEEYHELLKTQDNEHNKQKLEGFGSGGDDFDKHMFGDLSEEEVQKMMEEAKKMVKRTIEKTSRSHSTVPDSIQDLLEKLENELNNLDHKNILRSIIKKTVSAQDRESTWNKPNKRYGVYSPGSRAAKMPSILFLADTSGSISHRELNTFLDITDEFLRVGTKTCKLGLWHTELYSVNKYKVGQRIQDDEVQSGGTDVGPALKYAKQTNPNLTIILTDGYFSAADEVPTGEVLWIISEGGQADHPHKNLGKTIALDRIIGKKDNK
jgi:predicted metal-dependent peptidase